MSRIVLAAGPDWPTAGRRPWAMRTVRGVFDRAGITYSRRL